MIKKAITIIVVLAFMLTITGCSSYKGAAEDWFENNLKDPGSLEIIDWGTPRVGTNGDYSVEVKYRAKNSFGGMVVSKKIFIFNKDDKLLRVY